jgi:hypothetical protein
MKTSKLKKMPSGSCLTSKIYDKIIKMPSKSHETIPLRLEPGAPMSAVPIFTSQKALTTNIF